MWLNFLSILLVLSVFAKVTPVASTESEAEDEQIKKNEKRQLVLTPDLGSFPGQLGIYDQIDVNKFGQVYSPGFRRGINSLDFDGASGQGGITRSPPIFVLGNNFHPNRAINFPNRNRGIGRNNAIILVTLPDGRNAILRPPYYNNPHQFYPHGYHPFNSHNIPNVGGIGENNVVIIPGRGIGFNRDFQNDDNNIVFGIPLRRGVPRKDVNAGFGPIANNAQRFTPIRPSRPFNRDGNIHDNRRNLIGSIRPVDN